jgi:hypothetical protein
MYANAPWDIRHNFVLNAIYELPFGKRKMLGSNWNPEKAEKARSG